MTGFILAWAFVIIFGILVVIAIGTDPAAAGVVAAIYGVTILIMWHHNVFDPRSDIVVYQEATQRCESLKGELVKTVNKRDRYECRISPTITVPVD